MDIEKIKLMVELTTAKMQILKLKSDDYTWQCFVDEATKSQLMGTLVEIDGMLAKLRESSDKARG